MLFNSWPFLFLFLPAFFILREACGRLYPSLLTVSLLTASLVFYALWGLPWFFLLLAMIGLNFCLGKKLATLKPPARTRLFLLGLILNLIPLVWFKYSWFIVQNLSLLFHSQWQFIPPALPLGISFYTFIQIAWLFGIYRGLFQPEGFLRHALFSCAFPYVISGPIVRYDQLSPQLQNIHIPGTQTTARGLTLFGFGLAKKVILADSIGFYANAVFNAAEKNWPLSTTEAWLGSFCYTFQLYFDFSGYTDMALGLGLLLGLQLPENFASPYKSTGIIDFWRRWHITLGTWLRDFIYIPMGGSRHGHKYCNLFLTMLLGGIWHGAGWTFIIWGLLQGFLLCINHFFRSIANRFLSERHNCKILKICSILLTFFCINFCWVIFRAASLDGAVNMYQAMFMPDGAADLLPNRYFTGWQPFFLLPLCFFICWAMPCSSQIVKGQCKWLYWSPSTAWALGMAGLGFISLALLSRQNVFLYFQF